jgi:hypothetical protein
MPEWIAKYWLEWLFGIVVTVIGIVVRKINQRVKETSAKNDAIELGIQALLRAQLVDDYNHYMAKGEFPIYARESFNQVYKQYKKLGGNGVMTDLHDKLIELPTPIDKD